MLHNLSLPRLIAALTITAALLAAAGKPKDAKTEMSTDPPVYRIGPGDILQIDVWKEPDVSNQAVSVRPDGKITVAIVGELQVSGLTPTELETILAGRYGSLIRDPRVTITIREINSQKVHLIGEVRREGSIRLIGPMTVLQALSEAGGITDYAKRKRIYILRMVGKEQVSLPFDYESVVRGQKVEQNVLLFPGDTIVVPR